MKLFKYEEFITESQIQFLIESNIDLSNEFISVLKKVNSPISQIIIDINGKEVNINQNFIDINKEKTDTLFFKPDDKVGKMAKVDNHRGFFPDLSYQLSLEDGTGFDKTQKEDFEIPQIGQTGQIIKKFDYSEIESLLTNSKKLIGIKPLTSFELRSLYSSGSLCLFQWVMERNEEQSRVRKKYQILAWTQSLDFSPEVVKNSEISVGRFVRALLNKSGIKFKDAEIEDFVYKYRAEIEKEKNVLDLRFKVVDGDDIKKYYHRNIYETESGSLGSSCMRYDRCSMYLSIFTDNSQVKLLLLMSEAEPDKIAGRALLWKMEPYEISTNVMDRIYTIRTADEQLFKEWAIENGYWFKEKQDYSDYTNFNFQNKETGEIEKRNGEFSIKLDNGGEYPSYPYMDSFKYYNPKNGTLYNSSDFDYEYELTDTEGGNGSCSECGGSGRVECGDCDGDGKRECYECGGRGNVDCEDCEGSGKDSCGICDGDGDLECSSCDGDGKVDCDDCDGDGEIDGEECENCSGSGKQECSDCDGEGRKECYKCDGDGDLECSSCDGDGRVDCGDCDGDGERECYNCDGNGRVDCSEC